jgi:hypothetical protein
MKRAKKMAVKKKAEPKKQAAHAPAKKGGGKGLLIAAIMIGVVSLIGVQIYFKARKEASLKFDVVRVGAIIAQGLSDGQGMSPVALQGDKEDNLFFLDGQGGVPSRLQKFSPDGKFIKRYEPKTALQMITNAVDIDVDPEGGPWVLLGSGDVIVLDAELKYLRTLPTRVSGPSGMGLLPDGRFVVASRNDNKACVFGADGKKVSEFGGPGTKTGDLSNPVRLRVTQSGLIAVMEILNSGLHLKVFGPDFKLQTQFNLDKLPWGDPVKMGVTNDDKVYFNDHIGGKGMMIWSLKNGDYLGVTNATTDNQFFISPGAGGANKYTKSFYVHSVNGLTKCRMQEGK